MQTQYNEPPNISSMGNVVFRFVNSFDIRNGTIANLSLICDVATSTTPGSTYQWSLTPIMAGDGNPFNGADGGQKMAVHLLNSVGPIVTVAGGQ